MIQQGLAKQSLLRRITFPFRDQLAWVLAMDAAQGRRLAGPFQVSAVEKIRSPDTTWRHHCQEAQLCFLSFRRKMFRA